jgi:septum formation protein
MSKLVLASASPRRQALLKAAGVDFEIQVSGINEEDHAKGTPRAIALKTALAKVCEVAGHVEKDTLILGADTMVIMDEHLFNKPVDRDEARRMLRALSGRTHTVVTALALLRVGGVALVDAVYADVTFNELGDELIEAYVASGEADDKAGAYGIQGRGAQFIGAVEGDLTCVIGLPMGRLREMHQEIAERDLFAGRNLREVALQAFPDLKALPAACLAGI